MVRRTRKPPVKLEQRKDWLRRYEEENESQIHIAHKDGFDIRTVKKQIELAKEEREAKEARGSVLRRALEDHYKDLVEYAARLDLLIHEAPNVDPGPDDDLFKEALRQHLPRSPLWAYLSKREDLTLKFEEQRKLLDEYIEKTTKYDRRLKTVQEAGLEGIIHGIIELLTYEAEKHWLNGNIEYSLKDNVEYEKADKGMVSPHFGAFHLGAMPQELAEKYMPIISKVIGDLDSQLKNSEEYSSLEKTHTEISRLKVKLREELAVIRLRRIVSGRCKYCPL